jgi:diaminohydroxyphosphoribosylaminopyrimidine deaminase/5-amino-6-(5-phosphoribosylamino)uracil reductase
MSGRQPDLAWIDRAIELAERGRFGVSPNPMVGAIVVRDGRVVGEGYHRRAGGPHAEVVAIARAGEAARGADLYVSLEPCVHFGRTPPCVDAICASGVRRVIAAAPDPNPLVRGRGFAALARAGIPVLRANPGQRRAAELQNEKFRVWITERRPFVLAKWASTLDGRIASAAGRSRWITGPEARRRALLLREEYDAVLVGAGTIRADDPLLTRRLGRARERPHRRIVLDGRLRVSPDARVFRHPEGVVLVTAQAARSRAAARFSARGVEVWSLPGRSAGRVSPTRLLQRLAQEQIASVMVEGGSETLWQFFRGGLVDRIAAFIAPRVVGGREAPGAVGGSGFTLSGSVRLGELACSRYGQDLFVTAPVRSSGRR